MQILFIVSRCARQSLSISVAVVAALAVVMAPGAVKAQPVFAKAELVTPGGQPLSAKANYRGVAAYDFDGDGRDDVLWVGANGATRLWQNRGDWMFEDVTSLLPLEANVGYGAGVWGDLDGDGDADLVLGGWASSTTILRNDGLLGFTDVGLSAGIIAIAQSAYSLNLADVNGDGRLDIYVSVPNAPNHLYLNRGDITFVDAADALGANDEYVSMGAVLTDLDRDGDTDLYLTHDARQPNLLLHYRDSLFESVGTPTGANVAGFGMGADARDLDGDGLPELYITNLYENALLQGSDWRTSNIAAGLGVTDRGMGWGVTMFDADLDGQVDIYVGNESAFNVDGKQLPNVLYVADADGAYVRVDTGALDSTASTFGVASADLDGDGDHDLLLANGSSAPCGILRNDSPGGNHWFQLRTPRVGIQATVYAGGRSWYDETTAGSGYASQSAPALQFGFGPNIDRIDSLVVMTRQGRSATWTNLAVDSIYQLSALPGAAALADETQQVSSVAPAPTQLAPKLQLWPNPARGTLFLGGASPGQQAEISNLQGLTWTLNVQQNGAVDISALAAGVYVVRVVTLNGVMEMGRVVVY